MMGTEFVHYLVARSRWQDDLRRAERSRTWDQIDASAQQKPIQPGRRTRFRRALPRLRFLDRFSPA